MPRRVALPAADDLFRATSTANPPTNLPADSPGGSPADSPGSSSAAPAATGRVKHDQKMTIYLSSDELFDLEQARLALRKLLGTSLDRGRLVRTAVALALADLAEQGEHSALATRLADETSGSDKA